MGNKISKLSNRPSTFNPTTNVEEQLIQPNAGQQHAQPNVGQQHVQPNVGQQLVQPNVGQQHAQPNVGQQHVQPNVGQQLVQPNVGQQLVQPNVGQQHVHPNVGLQLVQPNVGQQHVQPNVGQLSQYNLTQQKFARTNIEHQHGDLTINQYSDPTPVDVNSLAEELKGKLTVHAKEIVGETVLPIQLEREIKRVKLQITEVRRQHIIYGDDYDWEEHMKSNVPLIPTTDGSRIAIDQLFDKAKETATRAAPTSTTDEAKEKYIKQHGNTAMLIGLPGVGKTTTSKMVTKSILDKMILPVTEYLFYISIKNVNFKKKVSPFRFLIDNSLTNWLHCDKENKELINVLHNNPNVVIVMDGLDEAAAKFSETPKNCPLDGKSKPIDIIKNLFNSTLLPNAVKLATSRPGQFYQIHQDCRPTFVLEVLGLDQNAIDDLGIQICGERYPEIKKFLKERPNLSALCYVPVNCILIMACLLICLSTGKEINSMTQVLIYALTHYMTSEHLKSDMKSEEQISLELVKLSQLAFKGFKKQKLVFNIKDFKKVKITKIMANNFMHTYVDKASGMRMKILEGHKRSYFSHLMWQEFLTAVYMMLFMPYEQFQRYDFIFEESQWEVVARFMFGICNPTSKADLELIFPTLEIKDFKEKKKMILDIISRQQIDPSKDNFNTLLGKVSGWMHELDDKDIINKVEQHLPTDITMKVPSNPAQARDLAFAFKSCSAPYNLTVQANDPETFLYGLQGSTKTKIKKLVLNGTELGNVAEYLVPHIQHIDELTLWDCYQLNDCMRDFCTAINDRPNKIKLTVRRVRRLDDHAAQCLAGCVGKISELDLDWSNLSPEGQRMLQEAIQQLPSPQIKLTVRSCERLDDHTAQCLAGCVGKISELDLDWSKLSPESQRMLQEAIKQLPSPQIKLTVGGYGRLDDHAAQCLAGCVDKISELNLNWNELSPEGQRMLQETIQQLPSPQIKLTVRSDWGLVNKRLDDHAAQCLAGCVGKISELDLDWSKLSPEGQRMLQEAIQQLPFPQIKLTVGGDGRLDDHAAQCLAGCVGKISELNLNWNKLSTEGQRMLQEAIQQLPSPQNFILEGH